jgi:hypothetical protein
MPILLKILAKVIAVYAPAAVSTAGVLNVEELKKVAYTTALHGVVAAAVGVLSAILADLPTIVSVPIPFVMAGIASALTAAIDAIRRLDHGN